MLVLVLACTATRTTASLPRPLQLDLADRRLFSHYLWNSSLRLAELVERDTLSANGDDDDNDDVTER
jgi:hypothetical protein